MPDEPNNLKHEAKWWAINSTVSALLSPIIDAAVSKHFGDKPFFEKWKLSMTGWDNWKTHIALGVTITSFMTVMNYMLGRRQYTPETLAPAKAPEAEAPSLRTDHAEKLRTRETQEMLTQR